MKELEYHWSYYRNKKLKYYGMGAGNMEIYAGKEISFENRKNLFAKQMKDKNEEDSKNENKNIYKIEKEDNGKATIHFVNGQIFTCSGKLVDKTPIINFSKPRIKKLF